MQSGRIACVIDPDLNARELLREYLSEAGFEVTDFSDPSYGLEQIQRLAPVVVVAEVLGMPIDGFAVCRGVRLQEGLTGTAVVLTSFLFAEDRTREVDADAFLLKPFEKGKVLNVVEEAIGRRRALQGAP